MLVLRWSNLSRLRHSHAQPILEFARGQGGNNNAYCQDDELTWFDLPELLRGLGWQIKVDTADPAAVDRAIDPSAAVQLTGRSLMLLGGTAPAS